MTADRNIPDYGTFTILLDRDRVAHNAYQLERSRLRSWHSRVVWVYIKRWFQHGEFYDSHGDDTSQLGGDFIVDKNGVLRLVHPSHDSIDRPLVEKLIATIKGISYSTSEELESQLCENYCPPSMSRRAG